MQNQDKISKILLNYINATGDSIKENIIKSIEIKYLSLNQESTENLLRLIDFSLLEVYHKSQNVFSKELEHLLEEESNKKSHLKNDKKNTFFKSKRLV